MDNTDQIQRIAHMEHALDEASLAAAALSSALERYQAALPQIRELTNYMDSGQWLQDYDDDRAGKLPHQLKRGVLSEDALYDLLAEASRLRSLMRSLE